VSLHLYDAHNHLQDSRFGGRQAELIAACRSQGVQRMVVNGSCEADWPEVLTLAGQFPEVLPSFGCHPWYVHERTPGWLKILNEFLDQVPSTVGEIGLDRWKPDLSYAGQEEVFIAQLRVASERNLPASIHCLQAWGRMLEILKTEPRPARGFLLHSYGGPKEMVKCFADLGA
jgi:TatD DNase family protein